MRKSLSYEMRRDFRVFRLDRMRKVVLTNTSFPDEPERGLGAYLLQQASSHVSGSERAAM
jgi:predicted DNA-binding transcriptional regulator YafY